ncbi:MAG TPA: heavy-metal-associated domain-containing protein [Tepiditoga sp.]|nr:heavy-metal-associated domain-containing protein [Thermotogota bacterium]HOO73962.1 heavy-metal-associated domain-containing protein [Tepiditoga sp.]
MKFVFTVNDMTCNHCKMRIENALKTSGAQNIDIDLVSKKVVFDSELSKDALVSIIDDAGYTAE